MKKKSDFRTQFRLNFNNNLKYEKDAHEIVLLLYLRWFRTTRLQIVIEYFVQGLVIFLFVCWWIRC